MFCFLMMPWVGLQCVIVAFSDHTQLLFVQTFCKLQQKNKQQQQIFPLCLNLFNISLFFSAIQYIIFLA